MATVEIDFKNRETRNCNPDMLHESVASAKSYMLRNGFLLQEIETYTMGSTLPLHPSLKMDMRFFEHKKDKSKRISLK